jgi:DNA invertase Pin-like site-specific DNA recombinase
MLFGYARVSSKDQNEGRQIISIKEYCKSKGLEIEDRNIITDKESGKDFNREGYKTLTRQLLRAGDTLIIKELDRLGRNKEEIKKELEYLKDKGVTIRILNIPTTLIELPEGQDWVMDMVNNILIEVMGAVAEEERVKIRQRQREGINQAKAEGKHLGRPRMDLNTISKHQRETIKDLYPNWKDGEITATKFMEEIDLKRNTFYKIIKQYEETL